MASSISAAENLDRHRQIASLHAALSDIAGVINRSLGGAAMARETGVSLERALLALLIAIARDGPVGVVDLAMRVGRDYTTVSRQIARLEALGLVARRSAATDRRVREAVVTAAGQAMTDAAAAARERITSAILASWDQGDAADLVRLVRRFADALPRDPGG